MAKTSQRAKLVLKALPNLLTKDVTNDYYFTVKTQKSLSLTDLAQEVAATHGHQNASEVEMLTREVLELAAWYLSSGYTVTTPLGYFRTTVSGTALESELNTAPDRSRLKLSVGYSMSEDMRQALTDAEIDVEIEKAKTGPQLYAVVSAQDAQNPGAATKGPVWQVALCTQLGNNGAQLLKEPRTVVMENTFVVGETPAGDSGNPGRGTGTGGNDGDQSENPLG